MIQHEVEPQVPWQGTNSPSGRMGRNTAGHVCRGDTICQVPKDRSEACVCLHDKYLSGCPAPLFLLSPSQASPPHSHGPLPSMIGQPRGVCVLLSIYVLTSFSFIPCVFHVMHLHPIHLPAPSYLPSALPTPPNTVT